MSTKLRAEMQRISLDSVGVLREFLASRHVFRGASIALKRGEKLVPLLAKVDSTHAQVTHEFESFQAFLTGRQRHIQ